MGSGSSLREVRGLKPQNLIQIKGNLFSETLKSLSKQGTSNKIPNAVRVAMEPLLVLSGSLTFFSPTWSEQMKTLQPMRIRNSWIYYPRIIDTRYWGTISKIPSVPKAILKKTSYCC